MLGGYRRILAGLRGAGWSAVGSTTYRERLRVPWHWWLLAALFVGSVALAYDAAVGGTWPLVATVVAGGLSSWWLVAQRTSIEVDAQGGLRVDAAYLPGWAIGSTVALDEQATRLARGRESDPRAFHALQAHIRTSVRVQVLDPADPVPYWLVSTASPESLAQALARPPR